MYNSLTLYEAWINSAACCEYFVSSNHNSLLASALQEINLKYTRKWYTTLIAKYFPHTEI